MKLEQRRLIDSCVLYDYMKFDNLSLALCKYHIFFRTTCIIIQKKLQCFHKLLRKKDGNDFESLFFNLQHKCCRINSAENYITSSKI